MVFRLFRRREEAEMARPPDGTVVYAVGDIHGYLDLLLRLEEQIEEDMHHRKADRRVVVYLGDYVDRGPDSRGVIEHFVTASSAACERVFLAGNHERWMLNFLENAAVGPPWLRNGGRQTLSSYGVSIPSGLGEAAAMVALQEALRAALPPAHVQFLQELRPCHCEGDYFFAHAGVRPGVALDEQSEDDLTWIREEFLLSNADFGKVVVHGHTPTHTPEVFHNRIGIDTGAFISGLLTAVILDGEKRQFLHS